MSLARMICICETHKKVIYFSNLSRYFLSPPFLILSLKMGEILMFWQTVKQTDKQPNKQNGNKKKTRNDHIYNFLTKHQHEEIKFTFVCLFPPFLYVPSLFV